MFPRKNESACRGLADVLEEQTQSSSYPRTMRVYYYQGNKPWGHCAVKLGKHYYSAYPSTHAIIPKTRAGANEDDCLDPSDYAPKLLAIWDGILKPMLYSQMVFEDHDECSQYPCHSVNIPLTEEQFKTARSYAKDFKSRAEKGEVKYSVVNFLGASCASFTQSMLHKVAVSPTELTKVEPTLIENAISWPQNVQRRADKLAEVRQLGLKEKKVASLCSVGLSLFARAFHQSQVDKRERHYLPTFK